jgi:hypothetical protein
MRILSYLICIVLLASCNNEASKPKTVPVDWAGPKDSVKDFRQHLQEKERQATERKNDTLGRLISTIEFNVMTYDSIIKKEEVISMIELDSADIKHLIGKEDIVLKDETVTLIIDYPLDNPDFSELVSKNGFTRQGLVEAIAKRYHEIYDEEEQSATIKTVPLEKRTGMYNRNETNGKYHIWGHDISDLVLTSIWVYKNDKGRIFLSLQIDS